MITVSASGMSRVQVNEDSYATGFMLGVELGPIQETMQNDGTWTKTTTPVSIVASVVQTGSPADERIPIHIPGESWAVGVEKSPRQLPVSPPVSLTTAECNVGFEFDVVISPNVGQPESAVNLLPARNRLTVQIVDDDVSGNSGYWNSAHYG